MLDLLSRGELTLQLSPFVVRFNSNVPAIARDIQILYADFDVLPNTDFADFHVELRFVFGIRRWLSPQVQFFFDGRPSFSNLPVAQAFPTLEWGLNWCVAAHSHQYLVIHAAVIERDGVTVLLPAPPGAGKSTLCAALIHRGWRLLSDELALFDFSSGLVFGMARPVSLKNRSIDIIRRFSPNSVLTTPVMTESKGLVALMKPPSGSVMRVIEPARPNWIILPKFEADSASLLVKHSPARTFLLIAEQSFNYHVHGQNGFKAVAALVDQCRCAQFTYSDLDDAIEVFSDLDSRLGK